MEYRRSRVEGNLFGYLEHKQKIESLNKGINKLSVHVDFESFRVELESILGYDQREAKQGGRPPFDPVLMFKMVLIQKFYGLSDQGTQEQVADRLSFMQFLGLEAGDDIPDANTLWDFKERLGDEGERRLFTWFTERLGERGLIGREGSIVDASFVEVPRQRNTREENQQIKQGKVPEDWSEHKQRQKDVDARSAVKNGVYHYGYKNHANADAKTKLLTKYEVTSAEVHDSQVVKELVSASDKAVIADSAYRSAEIEYYVLEECKSQEFILERAYRGKPLTEQQHKSNRTISRIRARVEHIFARLNQWGAHRVRTIGKVRAEVHIGICNLLYNMDRTRQLCMIS